MPGINEGQTRKELIDPALQQAGWDITDRRQVRFEIPVDGFSPEAWQRLRSRLREGGVPYDVELPKGVCDYALYRPNGEIMAVVEAKRTSVDPRLAEAQTRKKLVCVGLCYRGQPVNRSGSTQTML